MFLIYTLILFFWTVYCASNFRYEQFNSLSYDFKSPERLELFVKIVLDTESGFSTLSEESIFDESNQALATLSDISVSEQHLKSFKALCDNIIKVCKKANIDFSTNSLTQQDRNIILQKIRITSQEFNFAKNKNLKFFDFYDKDLIVKILLETLSKLDPFSEEKKQEHQF